MAIKQTNLESLSTTNAIVVVGLITFLVLAVCLYFDKGQFDQLSLNTRVINAKSKAADALDAKVANIPTLLSNYGALGASKTLILNSLPTDPDFPQLISQMERIAGASGIQLKGVSTAAQASAASGSGVLPVTFSTQFDTSYDKLQTLLKNIEVSARPIRVDSMTMSGVSNAMSVTLEMTTYYQPKADISDKMEQVK